jgi:hypothetical protein
MQDRAEYKKEWRMKNLEKEKARQAAYYQENKTEQRRRDLKSRYNLSLEEYEKMYEDQEGRCACCGKTEQELKEQYSSSIHSKLCVDHDHDTGKVRQLLCHKCNTFIGYLETRQDILGKAFEYIERHRKTT